LLYSIAKREQVKEKREPRVRAERKPPSLKALQEYIVAGLPFVNRVLARRLLKVFGTVERVFSASEKELQQVDGIGKKISKQIRRVLAEPYSEAEER
jgi:Fanconi anemia group M protein